MFKHRLKKSAQFLVILMAAVLTASLVSADPGQMIWRYQTGGSVASSPAVGADGTIYTGSYDGYVYAINPSGSLKWSYKTGERIYSSPALGADGTVYIGSYDNFLYAINVDGTLRWSYETDGDIYSSPAVGADGTVYVGNLSGNLYALNGDGTLQWVYATEGWIASSPAIGLDGSIYAGNLDHNLYAFNSDGTLQWTYETGGWIVSSPAVGIDGTIYVGSHDHYLYAMAPYGVPRWRYETGGEIWSSPAIGKDGTVYVGSFDKSFYALSPDGRTLKWSYETGGEIWSSPLIGADGTIYVGSNDKSLYAIGSDQTLKWSYETGGELWSAPAMAQDGTIYIGSSTRSLYAIEGDSPWTYNDYLAAMEVYADSAWPKFGQNSFGLGRMPVWVPPELSLSAEQAFPNYTVLVPLTLSNTGMIPIEEIVAEIEFDETVVSPVRAIFGDGVLAEENYEITYQEETGVFTVTIYARGTQFTGEGIAAYAEFEALGNAGSSSALSFAASTVNEDSVTATDGSVSIVQLVPPSLSLPEEAITVFPGGKISVPITMTNTGGATVEGLDMEITFNPEVVTLTEITLANGVLENENYGIQYNAENGTAVIKMYAREDLFRGEGEIAYLKFDAIGDVGRSSTLTFAKAQINELNVDKTNGSVQIIKAAFRISGTVGYYTSPETLPLRNVDVTITDISSEAEGEGEEGEGEEGEGEPEAFSATVRTGTNGTYTFSDIPMSDYVSTLSKADDLGGLTSTDASRIARYAAGFVEFDDYQMIAADVTMNGEVSGTDASRVARYLSGQIESMNSEGIHWVFISSSSDELSSVKYSPLDKDMENENFIAIRLGDVTGSWTAGKKKQSYPRDIQGGCHMDAGSVLTVPVILSQETAIEGIDMEVNFDPAVLEIADVTLSGGILEYEDYGLHFSQNGDGTVRIAIPARSKLFAGTGDIAFVTFNVIGASGDISAVSLAEFGCNEASAYGGFHINSNICRQIAVHVE